MPADQFGRAMRHLSRRDAVMNRLVSRLGRFEYINDVTPYQSLIQGIVYQQLSSTAASSILQRFLSLFGGSYPEPDQLLSCHPSKIRAAGIMNRKIEYMKGVASAAKGGALDPEKLRGMTDEQIIEELDGIRGVGPWTVHMLLIFVLGRPDVFPSGDLGIRKAMARAYGRDRLPTEAEALAFSERWRPYRTFASLYLWRAFDSAPWP
ncbi:MAG: DNA-3-methyladenine glycosylase 2 family protein [Nitrososphaerota archaeon]|nr:DNA-3-methyladenine glycosylase 2 family protein [Nitrososphaerota archaeon]